LDGTPTTETSSLKREVQTNCSGEFHIEKNAVKNFNAKKIG